MLSRYFALQLRCKLQVPNNVALATLHAASFKKQIPKMGYLMHHLHY